MSFSDLRYGWHQERFELTDVRVHSSVELLHRYGDRDWELRNPVFFRFSLDSEAEGEQREIAKEFESIELLRFARRRSLSAKARSTGFDHMYLGIPDTRQSGGSRDTQLDEIDLSIHAVESEGRDKAAGTIAHAKAREDHGPLTFIQLWVSDNVFDDIERIANQPNVSFEASVNVRGWHWLGPIGDSEMYVNVEKSERAELASIAASRAVTQSRVAGDADDDLAAPLSDPIEDVRRQVSKLMPLTESLKQAAWVTAGAAVGILIALIFRS